MGKASVVLNGGDVGAGLMVGVFTLFYAGFGGGGDPIHMFAHIGRNLAKLLFLLPLGAFMSLDGWRANLRDALQARADATEDTPNPPAKQAQKLVRLAWGVAIVTILLCALMSLPAVPVVFGIGMVIRSGGSPVGDTFRDNPLFKAGLLLIAAGFWLELFSVL